MKKIWLFYLCLSLLSAMAVPQMSPVKGAWKLSLPDGSQAVMICSETYLMYAFYDLSGKKYLKSGGGRYQASVMGITDYFGEFDTADTATIGKRFTLNCQLKTNELTIATGPIKGTWQRLDQPDENTIMAATWRISAREGNDSSMTPMQRGPRKTLKILSGNRFQWAAINPETKQFSGTGGGTYVVKDGKYTETIEFFSRDNSRVGASLAFDWAVTGKDWSHRGQSSTGGKVNEIWQKED